jgi:phospholipid/cholesterol/gamma-HCH transport system substrate-binding protein
MSIPFRERDPVIVGAISLAVVLGLVLLAFNADKLPIIGGGTTYYADFTEAGGLKADDEVRIAGVRVGKVDSVSLDGDHVKVAFRIQDAADFGSETRAAIKVKTLLGAMYLSLQPAGPGQLKAGSEIPTDRTSSPYDVVEAFSGLARTSDRIDTGRLARSLTTLADLTRHTPPSFRRALAGLSALSGNLAARDQQIGTLLTNLHTVSGTLHARDQDIVGLMRDSAVLFQALDQRRQAIHDLLRSTTRLSTQLTDLVRQSRADLKPALTNLASVVDVLDRDSDQIDQSIRLMAPFYRVFADTLGNGPWFDTYIQNLPPVPQVGG